MKRIETKEDKIILYLDSNDTFQNVKRILNHVSFKKYKTVIFETSTVPTSVIHKLMNLFVLLNYHESGNPYDNSTLEFEK